MNNKIAAKYSFLPLLKFCFPAIIMSVFTTAYTLMDAVFVSRYVNSDALSSINILIPVDGLIVGVAVMFGVGASAFLGKMLGEKKEELTNRYFSTFVLVAILLSFVMTVFLLFFTDPIIRWLGASEILFSYCKAYAVPIFLGTMPYVSQIMFNNLFITAGKPRLALRITLISGLLNLILDYLFMAILGLGISGAAWGTFISRMFGGLFPLIYFFSRKKGLHFDIAIIDFHSLLQVLSNGSSELITNLAISVTTYLYNIAIYIILRC